MSNNTKDPQTKNPTTVRMTARRSTICYDENDYDNAQLVIRAIAQHCTNNASSEDVDDLRSIGKLLRKKKATLKAKLLSQSETHYSYKVYVQGRPNKALFARASRKDIVLARNEFQARRAYAARVQESSVEDIAKAPTPYLCLEMGTTMTLLVTEWISHDEDFAAQFIECDVNGKVTNKVAKALATLNLTEVDPSFNKEARQSMESVFPQMKSDFEALLRDAATSEYNCCRRPSQQQDACVTLARKIGAETFGQWADKMQANFMAGGDSTLVHADTHPFNMLIGQGRSNRGQVYITDWEMAFCGPIGLDPGTFQCWPIACALAHAVQGAREEALDIVDAIEEFWTTYTRTLMTDGGKDKAELCRIVRNAMGWSSLFLFVGYYTYGQHLEKLPLSEGIDDAYVAALKGSLGELALQMMSYGFGDYEPYLTFQDLLGRQRELIVQQTHSLNDLRKVMNRGSYSATKRRGRNNSMSYVSSSASSLCF